MNYDRNYCKDCNTSSDNDYCNLYPNNMPKPPFTRPLQHCPTCDKCCHHSCPPPCAPYYISPYVHSQNQQAPSPYPISSFSPYGYQSPDSCAFNGAHLNCINSANPIRPIYPTGPVGSSSAFTITSTTIPSITGTTLSSAPVTLAFNAPLISQNINISDSTINLPNAGTYFIQLTIPVNAPSATTLNLTSIGTNVTVTPPTYSIAPPVALLNYLVAYTALATTPGNGRLSLSLFSNAASDNNPIAFQGQVVIFQVAKYDCFL